MTLKQIRAALPTHIMLTPGVHRWREGDEAMHTGVLSGADGYWRTPPLNWIGEHISSIDIGRRKIPSYILGNQAWWALYNKLAIVNPVPRFDQSLSHFILTMYDQDDIHLDVEEEGAIGIQRGFNGLSAAMRAIPILGGESEIIKRLNEGHLYDKWLLEQIESGG